VKTPLRGLLCVAGLLAGCAGPATTPDQPRAKGVSREYAFGATLPQVRDCLLPKLDRLQPFNVQPGLTRSPTVRERAGGLEIIAQDETITLYVVTLSPSPSGHATNAEASSSVEIARQIDQAATQCGGKQS
jgi:hypothetical protein